MGGSGVHLAWDSGRVGVVGRPRLRVLRSEMNLAC